MSGMTLDEAIGQLICPALGMRRDPPYDAERVHAELDRYGWGGYIVFRDRAEAWRDRLAALQARARRPLLVASDLEHGAGQQLLGASTFPSAMAFGATDDPDNAYALGAWTAREALDFGVNWIFAPVADVTNNPLNPIINIRSFGGEPARVAAMVAAFVRGCQDQGALACAKHFPGHGDTETDSHTRLGSVNATRARLEAVEFPPFRAALDADVASIMTAHLAVPALDRPELPATLSRRILTDLLRGDWGYEGLIVTDALLMGGITRTLAPEEAAVQAIAAGCDVLLMPPDAPATFEALRSAVASGRLDEARIFEAAERVRAAKARVGRACAPLPTEPPGSLAQRVAEAAITLAKGALPTPLPARGLAIAVDDGVPPERLAVWEQAAAQWGVTRRVALTTTEAEWQDLEARAAQAGLLVIGVFSGIQISKDRSLLPEKLVGPLTRLARLRPAIVISFSSPFLVAQFPDAIAWLLAYGSHPAQITGAIARLRAGGGFNGKLPLTLPAILPPDTRGRQDPHDASHFA
ncbi:MAG TPA: glycoside hydrolase family 3 N-terminal domain-containing protein [Oscillatoriaceae cyanobacterium]